MLVLLAGLWFSAISTTLTIHGQAPGFQSIHAEESERHRGLIVQSVPGRYPLRPLARDVLAGLSHTVFGFYPYWAPGYSQIRFQDITHLAVFSVETDEAGRLVNLHGWPNGPLIELAHQNGVRVVLVCTLFDASKLQALLGSASARQSLVGSLRNQVVLGGADGVNIDFEEVPGGQRANLVSFMRELATAVRVAVPGAHISIDTPAVDWSAAFDVPALAEICDALMIMGYDYYWSTSTSAGPVAPLESSTLWGKSSVRATVTDYLAKVGSGGSRKLILGVPYYGLDWPTESDSLRARTLAGASSKIYTDARKEALVNGRRWENFSSTPWYLYRTQTVRQVWYDDAESLSRKYDLVLQYSLQGIGIWALTYDRDTNDLWNLIENRFTLPPLPEAPDLLAPATFFDAVGLPVALRERGNVPATAFELAVGSTPGAADISDYRSIGLRHQFLIRGFRLETGKTYYVTARSVNAAGVPGASGRSVPILIDTSRAPERRFIPHWISNSEYYTGLALVNAAPETRAVVIRGFLLGQGQPIETSWVLASGQQMVELLSQPELLGSAAQGKEGWLDVSYLGGGLPSMFLFGDTLVSRSLDGGPLLAAGRTHIVPELDSGLARLSVANPGSESVPIQIKLLQADGSTAIKALRLSPGELVLQRISELFPDAFGAAGKADPAPQAMVRSAHVQIESERPVVCSSRLQRIQDTAEVPGLDVSQTLKAGVFSYVPFGGGYRSQAVLVNPTSSAQPVQVRLIDAPDLPIKTLEIPDFSALTVDLAKLLGIENTGPGGSRTGGVVEVTGLRGPGILGNLWIRTEDHRQMAALPLEPAGSSAYIFPQLAQAQGYWTGMSLCNPTGIPSDVTVTAFDKQGVSLGAYTRRLRPGELLVGLLPQWIGATQGVASGRVEVRSTGTLIAAQIIGSDESSFIAVVPGR